MRNCRNFGEKDEGIDVTCLPGNYFDTENCQKWKLLFIKLLFSRLQVQRCNRQLMLLNGDVNQTFLCFLFTSKVSGKPSETTKRYKSFVKSPKCRSSQIREIIYQTTTSSDTYEIGWKLIISQSFIPQQDAIISHTGVKISSQTIPNHHQRIQITLLISP